MEELKPIIRSLAISSAGGLTLQQLERDFNSLEGYSIPYQRLGFKSLASLLQTLTDVVQLKGKDQQSTTIHPVTTEKNEHILALVKKSKKKKKKPTLLRQPLPQRPGISSSSSSSKPCNDVQKHSESGKGKHSSYGHSSRGYTGAVTTTPSSPWPSSGYYSELDYYFEQFLQYLYAVLKDNENSNGQPTNRQKGGTAQPPNYQNCQRQNRQQNRPPSAECSGWNYNPAGWNNNSSGRNNNSAGWNNGNGSNNNSAGYNNNYAGYNNNYAGWGNNYAGWSNNSAGWNNNYGGLMYNSSDWNNNSTGYNPNPMAQRQMNMNYFAYNGNNWNGNYPQSSNYGNNGAYYNGYNLPVAAGYQYQYENYGMNYPSNYGYNNYPSNGPNTAAQNSYGQFLPYDY
ncbi:probable serine/threonine-protein kinase clkA [Anopheles maculipalpis]|uniref:probable serine/threonine-protein kinase clkA n=1 Tax=Anopheles maculipalpis TaxID=1496333 RepID=UPI002159670E|nr:probable serine/threonine-protein kinase clkA [Anopheles maculipalpis]